MPESRGRYQSKVLGFLSQQSMQLRDRLLETLRETQFNVSWGIQVALYPVYVLFQSGRLVGQQLQAVRRRFAPLLEAVKDDEFDPAVGVPPLDVNAPINHVLGALDSLQLPIEFRLEQPSSPTSNLLPPALSSVRPVEASSSPIETGSSPIGNISSLPLSVVPSSSPGESAIVSCKENLPQPLSHERFLVIQGVASSLETRHLVLTNIDNQALDILSVDQQRWLYQRIVFEVASYRRKHTLIQAAQVAGLLKPKHHITRESSSWRFLPPPRNTEALASPIRFFRTLMGWMQTSPIAVSSDLFQESALPQLKGVDVYPVPEPLQISALNQSLQSLTALLFGEPPTSPPFQSSQEIQSTDPGPPPFDRPGQPNDWVDPDHHSSMDGWLSANQLSHARRQAEQFLVTPSLPFRRRWVSNWDEQVRGSDSLVDSPIQPDSMTTEGHTEDGHHFSGGDGPAGKALARRSPGTLSTVETGNGQASDVQSASERDPKRMTSSQAQSGNGSSALTQTRTSSSQSNSMSPSPTFVDTKATVVGYETHPLEQVLQWIDGMMLWLENNASKALKWLQTVLKLDKH